MNENEMLRSSEVDKEKERALINSLPPIVETLPPDAVSAFKEYKKQRGYTSPIKAQNRV